MKGTGLRARAARGPGLERGKGQLLLALPSASPTIEAPHHKQEAPHTRKTASSITNMVKEGNRSN